MPLTRYHATAFLGPPGRYALEELRRTWDPEMTRQIPAHVTLIYPEEIPGPAELAAATRLAAARIAPFTIALGPSFHAGSPADGVFLHINDPDDGIGRLRAVAVPAGRAIGFPPHVTIVHPRTSRRGVQAWTELADVHLNARVTITEVAITAYDGDRWPTLETIPLTGPEALPRPGKAPGGR